VSRISTKYCKHYAKKHPDEDFIKSFSNGSGMSYEYNSVKGIARIGYIYGVPKYKIFAINLKLIFLWIKRQMMK
jgi:hypothetical protein